MSTDLILKPQCGCCGATSNLYGSNCKHMTLCVSCGKTMAEKKAKCHGCGAIVTRLIREYNVRASTVSDKNYFIARFGSGLPNFSKKKSAENKWSVRKHNKEGGLEQKKYRQPPASRDKDNNEPWVLEDETGHSQYEGRQSEGAESATKYYLLMRQGKEFCAIPAGSSFTFNKKINAQYKQLTTEEAEEKMNSRKRTEDGYDRWMMKEPKGSKKMTGEDGDKGNLSDKEEEENDDEQETERKSRLELNKKGGDDDLDDDGGEKGDDWEHENFFSDDEEDVISPEERQDFEPVVPAPSKMDDEDDDEEGGGLSKTGKELKILLGRSCGLNGSDAEEDDNLALPQLVAPKHKDAPKLEEPVVDKVSPVKPVPSGSGAKANPSVSMYAKGKRKLNGDETIDASPKKVKTENGNNSSVPSGPVSEEEIRAVLKQKSPITLSDLVNNFPRSRLTSKDEFAAILRKICKIEKKNGIKYIVLKEN